MRQGHRPAKAFPAAAQRLIVGLLLAGCGLAAFAQQPPASGMAPAVPQQQPARQVASSTLEQRLQMLSKELNLTDAQRRKVRDILVAQRARVRQIWSNPAIDPNDRAPATQAVTERTGDEIRAVLDEEQRKKYNQTKPDMPIEAGSRRGVDEWMRQMSPQEAVNAHATREPPVGHDGTPAGAQGQ
jgi:hypothetical protein